MLSRKTWQLYALIILCTTLVEIVALFHGVDGHVLALFVGMMGLMIGKIWEVSKK